MRICNNELLELRVVVRQRLFGAIYNGNDGPELVQKVNYGLKHLYTKRTMGNVKLLNKMREQSALAAPGIVKYKS